MCGCGGGGGSGPQLAAQIAISAYDALVAENEDFQTQFPDPAAYPMLGWELYRDAINDIPLSWSGGMTGHELEEAYRIGNDVYFEAISNVTGRVEITINGVTGQNTRVQFSDIADINGGTHTIPDLVFPLLPAVEAGQRQHNIDGPSDDPPSAWIRINSYSDPGLEGTFWRHNGYSGEFEAEREGQ